MAIIQAVITNLGREVFAKSFLASLSGYPQTRVSYFQIGMGGFVQTVNGRIPKNPDPARTNLEATGAPGSLIFQKSFGAADVGFGPPSFANLTLFIGLNEANDDGLGNPPKFYELGVFDDLNNMMAYGTFPEETKTNSKTLNHVVTIVF